MYELEEKGFFYLLQNEFLFHLQILYMSISSSEILWEEEVKKGRFKPLPIKVIEELEEKYQEGVTNKKQLNEYQVFFQIFI